MKFPVLFFLTLLISMICGGFTISVKPPVHKIEQDTIEEIQIAFTGKYPKDNSNIDISENAKQWYGVFPVKNGKYKISVTRIHVIDIISEDDDSASEQRIISVDGNINPLFLFKGIKTPNEQVQANSIEVTKKMYPGTVHTYDITVGATTVYYDLYGQGSAYIDTSNTWNHNEYGIHIKNYSLCLSTRSYNNITTKPAINEYIIFSNNNFGSTFIPSIDFMGDIDNDNKPDFLISYPLNTYFAFETTLYLSSKMFKPVANWKETFGGC